MVYATDYICLIGRNLTMLFIRFGHRQGVQALNQGRYTLDTWAGDSGWRNEIDGVELTSASVPQENTNASTRNTSACGYKKSAPETSSTYKLYWLPISLTEGKPLVYILLPRTVEDNCNWRYVGLEGRG